jgi:hypothetical protein
MIQAMQVVSCIARALLLGWGLDQSLYRLPKCSKFLDVIIIECFVQCNNIYHQIRKHFNVMW